LLEGGRRRRKGLSWQRGRRRIPTEFVGMEQQQQQQQQQQHIFAAMALPLYTPDLPKLLSNEKSERQP
jgi:hypothetical protein